ncbi:MAG TPA: hypothetical protein VL738_01925 [Dactylosporangium sp.]|jgi:hypothetical protein|nr:hypothetical protein [Dactylosporangium sp.]
MSNLERRAWIYAVVAVVVPVAYAVALLVRAPAGGIAASHYAGPMVAAVVGAIVLNIVAGIVAGMWGPGRAEPRDERDRAIDRLGEYVAFYVFSIAAVVPLVLAMREAPYFWIANSLYLGFSLAALVSSVVKIVAYRRGF